MEIEARDIVRRLRPHPCLAVFCGDNESDMTNHDHGADFRANRINHEVLPRVVRELSPGTHYHPSSPFGFDYPRSPWSGDNRNWGPWDPTDNYSHIRREESRFISEAGAYALPSIESIRTWLKPENQWPCDGWAWDLRGGSTDTYRRDFVYQSLRLWRRFSEFDDIESAVEVSQFAQAWGAMVLFLHCRRRWPETGGVLWWKLDDAWPCMDGGVIEYGGRRRLLYYSLKYSLSPVVLCFFQDPADDTVTLHCINHSDSRVAGIVDLFSIDPDSGQKRNLEQVNVDVPPMRSVELHRCETQPAAAADRAVLYARAGASSLSSVAPGIWAFAPSSAWCLHQSSHLIADLWGLPMQSTGNGAGDKNTPVRVSRMARRQR